MATVRGRAGSATSRISKPAGCSAGRLVWYATTSRAPTTSSELERSSAGRRSPWKTTAGVPGGFGGSTRGDVLGRRLGGEPQDAATIPGELDGHALATVAETVQLVVG